MPAGHDGQHSPDRHPGALSRRWDGDARPPKPAAVPTEVSEEQRQAANLTITSGWLVEEVDEHTCGTDRDGYYGHHEPGYGQIPVMQIDELVALFDALAALSIPINRAPERLPRLFAEAEARGRAEGRAEVAGLRERIEALIAEEPTVEPKWEFERGVLRGIDMVKEAMRRALADTEWA
jgi:hypothetical protein